MLKNVIISKLDSLAERLAASKKEWESWRELLVTIAETYGREDFKERVKSSILALLGLIEERRISLGLKSMASEISDFPLVDIYDVLIEALAEKRREDERKIKELGEVLSELSTPIVHLWKDVLLVPLIGTLDSQRAQTLVERLLKKIEESKAEVVIIDVTGVPMIDTFVGGFLIEMFGAVKLLGGDVVLCGVKPEIAHTLVKLNIDFSMVVVKRDLESALQYAIRKMERERKRMEELEIDSTIRQGTEKGT